MTRILITILTILIAGEFLSAQKNQNIAQAQMPPAAMEIEVNTITIKKEKISPNITLPARVTARKIADVRPQIDGIIKKRKFAEGQFVKENQELYEIDQTPYKIALNSAKTNYASAKENLKRLEFLLKEEAVSKKEYDDAKTTFARAKAELENAQINLTYSKVLAPIDGYISKSNLTEGNLVAANQTAALAIITQLKPIFVDMVIASKNFSKIKDQKEVKVGLIIDGINYEEEGILKFSEVYTNQSTDSIKLRAEFANENEKLLPGMFVKANLHLQDFDAITLPQKATTRMPDGSLSAWILDKNQMAHMRKIKTAGIFQDSWIVEEGLDEGDILVLEGYQKLSEGAKVKAVEVGDK